MTNLHITLYKALDLYHKGGGGVRSHGYGVVTSRQNKHLS